MRPPRTIGFTIVNLLLFWAATALAAAALWPVYQDPQFLIVAAGALVLGSVTAVVGSALRWPAAVVVLVGFVLFVLAGVPLAVPSKAQGILPTPEGLIDLVAALALSWKQLLTITLPVGTYQALLVPAFASILVSTVVGLSIALRAQRGELAVIPPVVLFLVGIAFGPTTAFLPITLSLGLLAVVLLWLVWRRGVRRRAAIQLLAAQTGEPESAAPEARVERAVGLRTLLAAGLILAIAAGSSAAAAAALPPSESRQVLRTAVEQPFDPRSYVSPLSAFRSYLKGDAADELLMTVSGLPADGRIRIATLDSYDGIVYAVGSGAVDSASGTFVRVPTAIDESRIPGTQVDVDVQLQGYSGVWLPTVGALESVDFAGADGAELRDAFFYNDTSRTAAVIGGVGSGDSYTLHAVAPAQPAEQDLAAVTPGSAGVPRIGLLPDELALKLEEYTSGVDGAGAQLLAAVDGLRREGYISHGVDSTEPPSRSGHAADRITELMTGTRMLGDAEQYSVAAVLMARQLGFPARVVFGFAPEVDGGAVQVRGSDVSAWIEVDTAEHGWVTVDPVPPVRPIPDEEPEDPTQIARPQSPVQPPPDEPEPNTDQTPPDTTQDDAEQPDAVLAIVLAVLRIGGIVLAVALLVAAPFLVVIAAKARRRRHRRRTGGSGQRISGAWDEFRDSAVDRGYVAPPATTRSEFADTVGLAQSRILAAVADRAVFAPDPPDDSEADRVWSALSDLEYSLDTGRTRWQRLRTAISLRSLGGYGVRSLITRRGPGR